MNVAIVAVLFLAFYGLVRACCDVVDWWLDRMWEREFEAEWRKRVRADRLITDEWTANAAAQFKLGEGA